MKLEKRIVAKCPECGGVMEKTGLVKLTKPPQTEWQCQSCYQVINEKNG